MDRIEHGAAAEAEQGLEGSFATAFGLEGRRAVVEFLTVLALVIVLALATSVLLVPA